MADTAYVGIRIQGGLLPAELLSRLATPTSTVPGHTPADYGLAAGETVREAANRVWAYLVTAWAGYRAQLAKLPATDRATGLTRDRWLLILLDQLGYGRVLTTPAGGIAADGKAFPVSHEWGPVPIHLLGERIDLDRKSPGVAGAAGQAPQSIVQELLNRSEPHLWAILSNGSTLRLLRDSTSLVGSAYVEFDLEAIFDGELFSDFLLLFTLLHSTRLAVRDFEIGPASCWIEQWRQLAVEDGSRALDQLRDGVVAALETLGAGFLGHPANGDLRERYETGALSRDDCQHALLRVVYRLLFSFVAEDRNALLSPDATTHARQRYADFFSTARLRRVARHRRGGRHGDRWHALQIVWAGLGSDTGRPELGLAGIGGLFERGELDFLADAELSNEALLKAVRSLSLVREKRTGQQRVVNYRDLGAEELGSIYEALLEYVPTWNPAIREYKLGAAAGNTRKTTGSYYTPTSLIESLLDTALDPALDTAEKRGVETGDVESELLAVTVCDPACGSGHFLVAAARRIAKRLAAARTGEPEPPPEQVRAALREVIGSCIYGVDLNPLAAELAKVSLWLEAMEPGQPLAFLDAQIKVGNALIGATPALLDGGLPQEAFTPIDGDDRKVVAALAKRNKQEAAGQDSLFDVDVARTSNTALAAAAQRLVGAGASLADVHVQQQRLRGYLGSAGYRQAKLHADAWCAAFVWPKVSGAAVCPTTAVLNRLRDEAASPEVGAEIERQTTSYRFFHWHLEFPHIFPTDGSGARNAVTGWHGGFTVVLGNPPWLSYSGRQAAPIHLGLLNLAGTISESTVRWPTSHGLFAILATALCQPSGCIGLVLPFQVAILESYEGVRRALTRAGFDVHVRDMGENAFPGISQRVGTFSMSASSGDAHVHIAGSSEPQHQSMVPRVSVGAVDELIEWLRVLPRFPKNSFKDPGVHTGNVAKKIILSRPYDEGSARYHPVREGKDISEFRCSAPRLWLDSRPELDDGEYCRIGKLDAYAATPIVLRQTASRPIATRHTAPTYFRNSMLACMGLSGVSDRVVVAVLNSALIGLWYQRTVLDAAQRAFPQVKVGALRNLPAPSVETDSQRAAAAALDSAVGDIETMSTRTTEQYVLVENLVCDLFGVPERWRSIIVDAVRVERERAS